MEHKPRRANLTEAEKAEIRELWKGGASYDELMQLLDCSYATIQRAIHGRKDYVAKKKHTHG